MTKRKSSAARAAQPLFPRELAYCTCCAIQFDRPPGASWMTRCRKCFLTSKAAAAIAIAHRAIKEGERL